MRKERIGFAFCGSFCNHPKVLALYEELAEEFALIPILSENAARYAQGYTLYRRLYPALQKEFAALAVL